MEYMNKVLKRMKQEGITPIPCTKKDMDMLYNWDNNYKLPKAYLEFMEICGRGTVENKLFDCCCTFFHEDSVLEGMEDLLEENESNIILKEGIYEFYTHSGYAYAFFFMTEGDNPPVYFYTEGYSCDRYIKIAHTFSEFIMNNLNSCSFVLSEVIPLTEDDVIELHKELRKFEPKENEIKDIKDIKTVVGVDFKVFDIKDKRFCICMGALVDYKTNRLIDFHQKIAEIPNTIEETLRLEYLQIQLYLLAGFGRFKDSDIICDLHIFNNSQIKKENQLDTATLAGILNGRKSTIGVFTNGNDIKISKGTSINSELSMEIIKNMTLIDNQLPVPLLYANRLAEEIKKNILKNI